MRGWVIAAALLVAVGMERPADAYDQQVHVYLSKRAYGGPKTVAPEDETARRAIRALRERLWRAGAESADAGLKQRFLARWPSAEKLDAWELKVLFGLNPDKAVAGIDEGPLPAGTDGAELYGLASRLPDDDLRNRDRFRHDAQRKVVEGPFGQPLPDDPATLDIGTLTGLPSQAHAHYQLARLTFSDDPDVLQKEPRRFAIPPTVKTFGADYAELYTALAVIASRLPAGERLALVHAGAAAHHVEDVANQIHTVQVGVYDFFVDAKIEFYKEELRSVGGLLRSRPTFVSIGTGIIVNHHSLAEALYEKHLLASGDPVRAQTEAAPPDPVFDTALAALPAGCAPGFGRAIVDALADRSSLEGAEVYGAIRAVADRKYSRVGHRFSGDPDAALRPGANLDAFYGLEVRGAIRSDQALSAWWRQFGTCAAAGTETEARFAEGLVRDRLAALEAKAARARAYVPKPPRQASVNPWVPAGYALLLALLLWIWRRMMRRRARTKG